MAGAVLDHVLDLAAGVDATLNVLNDADTNRDSVARIDGEVVERGSVHEETLAFVDDHDVDHLVVRPQGRTNLDRCLLGSVAEKLVQSSPLP